MKLLEVFFMLPIFAPKAGEVMWRRNLPLQAGLKGILHLTDNAGKTGKAVKGMKTAQYTLIKIPINEIMRQDFDVRLERNEEIEKEYLITQGDSLLFDQIARLRGAFSFHVKEVILVVAKKNPRQEEALRRILMEGFHYNGVHYSRFGKSASQGKEGITAFVCDDVFEELYAITQMDIPIEECVIAKYEAQRCLPFSSCTLIHDYMPRIVIIGEYEKTLQNQLIKYVVEKDREFTDEGTGETVAYRAKEIEEGYRDVTISPFDGCGCHEHEFTETVSRRLGLDYEAAGAQVRLPFIKGYSVYVPFREILKEWGYDSITDIYGKSHPIEEVDCIWNTSMFKGHGLFYKKYGNDAWNAYLCTLEKYHFKLGISKYSHHADQLSRYTRMNFQYLQCLDLWNPGYIECYEKKEWENYDILDEKNAGKIIKLARYTTSLFEKIIKGDKFYTCKFLGLTDSQSYEPQSRYLEAVLINDIMLKDPAVRQFLYRKLQKAIDEAKIGKIYCSGFYHTGVGDMIGYLQYAVGITPEGCLRKRELYSGNFGEGEIVSFRSPLVDASEVNRVRIAHNGLTEKWFSHFKDQDIVMFNMHDISAPQQGGADFDGDIFFLCDEPLVVRSKIDKKIIIDMEDKTTATPKPYTKENITEYEIMTRDNRIGEITNAATSIENKYTTDSATRKRYEDYTSLLRIIQGHEIDFIKTGTRWHMSAGLKKHLKQLPHFLGCHYDKKISAYRSPSPMNELCDYICTWEKKHILWDKSTNNPADTREYILDGKMDLSDRKVMRVVRRYVNEYADAIRRHIALCRENRCKENTDVQEELVTLCKNKLAAELQMEEEVIANYVIKVSYSSLSISKSFAWAGYGEYILQNLRSHSEKKQNASITEVSSRTSGAYEYLGRYYAWKEEEANA